jgi:hypothetical protein
MPLLKAYTQQSDVDVLLITTAGPRTSTPLFHRLFKFQRLPQADYYKQLLWITNALLFAPEYAARSRRPRLFRPIVRLAFPVLLALDKWLGRKLASPPGGTQATVLRPSQIGEEFDDLWDRVRKVDRRFMQVRDAANLRWRFGRPVAGLPPRVVCLHGEGRLLGYAVLEYTQTPRGMDKASLTDLLVEKDAAGVVADLLRQCWQQARRDGAGMLEVLGFPPNLRALLLGALPYGRVRDLTADYEGSFLYRATNEVLARALGDGSAWYASNSDGDTDL